MNAAPGTLRAQGRIGEGIACRVDTGDMLLKALVACAGVTLNAVATAFRGTLGVAKDAPVGFRDIRLHFHLDTEASAEQKKKLIELTERYCVVLQTLRHAPAIRIAS